MGDNKITVQAYGYYDTNDETSQKLYDYCLTMSDLVVGITPDVRDQRDRYSPVRSQDHSHQRLEQRELRLADRHAHQAGLDQYGVCNNYTLAGGREMSYLDVEKTNAGVRAGGRRPRRPSSTSPTRWGRLSPSTACPSWWWATMSPMDLEGWPEMDNIIVLPYTFNRT